jgi:hypothetical protein
MDLMARVMVGSERARQRHEAREAAAFHEAAAARAREAAAFHEAAAARVRADSLADAAAAAACAWAGRA